MFWIYGNYESGSVECDGMKLGTWLCFLFVAWRSHAYSWLVETESRMLVVVAIFFSIHYLS